MHNIIERPIAVSGKVEIHPMMYVALSYDHRLLMVRNLLVLVAIKEALESPMELLLDNN
jgi:2-oxoglutarate dehydrogenase E2 component (dihydrolipoamide succinyltransferase)